MAPVPFGRAAMCRGPRDLGPCRRDRRRVGDVGTRGRRLAPRRLPAPPPHPGVAGLAGRVPDQLEVRRFRPNVVVETFEGPRASSSEGGSLSRPEDAWVGHALQIGSVVVRVAKPTERCVMVTLPQPGIHFAPQVLRELETAVEGRLGVYADVITEGDIGVGDEVVRVD